MPKQLFGVLAIALILSTCSGIAPVFADKGAEMPDEGALPAMILYGALIFWLVIVFKNFIQLMINKLRDRWSAYKDSHKRKGKRHERV